MKLQDLIDVFNGDISITSWQQEEQKTIQAIPIGNLLRGSAFIMNLTVRKIDPRLDTYGALVWVDIPAEMMPGLIAYNDGFSITLEWEEC